MRNTFPLLVILSVLIFGTTISCKTEHSIEISDPEHNDENWMKLVIANKSRGVTAIYGNYEDTLIVATLGDIYMTIDKGKNWKHIFSGSLGISGFTEYKGELIAFSSFGITAHSPFLFSQNNGEAWSFKGKRDFLEYDTLETPRSKIEISKNLSFFIEYRYDGTNLQLDPITKLPLADQIYKIKNGEKTRFDLPVERRINCLYLDKRSRIYVGTEGTRFEYSIINNTKVYPTQTDSAILYISKKKVE